ncbi:putative major coat protein [Vibrio phage VALG_phi8]|uniref:Putative major coat protein n=2 Tax=root TaxID=1 RepID=A0A650EUE1_9VIRU|nr:MULTISPECIES: phage coat protein [Bacteria]YP_010768664.1 putative major coat protein [Vibrio phage VALG_phi8]ARP06761.1 putative major coat protein [Vibrio phage K04M1_VK04M1]ARP21948.1 putative major coat protein [Vibrio phage K05K4_VK05K4_1]ARP21982.1 putative major coat protein [Vibrio phage K05K4_VK05K4_2]ARP10687.1 putative major coat protein [Vibrio alginolyticus]ARP10700.1 putative major coat protein [Vibrio alginolyticus]
MKRLNALKKFGKQAVATVTVAVLSVPAMAAEGGAADPFSVIDLSGVATKIGAAGLVIVGITMAYKSITLAKRAVNKA